MAKPSTDFIIQIPNHKIFIYNKSNNYFIATIWNMFKYVKRKPQMMAN